MEENKVLLNKFVKGVNTDIAEDLIPADFLSSGHNIKFTNDDNKQGIVQKQESYIKELDGYGENLKPLAAKVFKDVIYLVSYNTVSNYVEYGSYPSADLTTRYTNSDGKEMCTKVYKYAPLPNYNIIEVVTAFPDIFNNIPYISAPVQVANITTATGINWEVLSSDAGITPAPLNGISGSNINLTIEDNPGGPIVKTVTIQSVGGEANKVIIVNQEGTPFILGTPDVFNSVPATGPTQLLVTISTHGPDWEYVSGSSGLVPVNTSGPSGYYMLIDVADNLSPGANTMGLTMQTIEASPIQETIVVHQLGAYLSVDVTDLYFDDSGQPSQDATVTSDTYWNILKSDSWIWVTGETDFGDDVFQVECDPNTGSARNGTVTVEWGGTDHVINIHQAAP